jgi:hypothetical protein
MVRHSSGRTSRGAGDPGADAAARGRSPRPRRACRSRVGRCLRDLDIRAARGDTPCRPPPRGSPGWRHPSAQRPGESRSYGHRRRDRGPRIQRRKFSLISSTRRSWLVMSPPAARQCATFALVQTVASDAPTGTARFSKAYWPASSRACNTTLTLGTRPDGIADCGDPRYA